MASLVRVHGGIKWQRQMTTTNDDNDASLCRAGERGRWVGVVGGGLSGLSAVYHLSCKDLCV